MSHETEKQTTTVNGPMGTTFEVISGRELPHSIEAEGALLAGVLADETGEAWAIALNCGVRPKAFFQPAATLLWELLSELRRQGQPGINIALLAEELRLRGQIDQVGGFAWLADITSRASTHINVRYYAEVVVLLWEMRHAVLLAGELRESAVAFTSRDDFASKAANVGQRLIGLGRKTAKRSMREEVSEGAEHVRAIAEGRFDHSRLVRTGIPTFDEKYGWFGIGGGDDKFVMIGGGSGHGKSVAGRQIAHQTLMDGKRVLAYTREQSVGDFVLLMASAATGYDLAQAATQPKDRTETFLAEVQRMSDEWAEQRLFVYSHSEATPLITVEDLIDHARAWCHLHGPPEFILIDFLQMFDTRKRFANAEQRVGYMAYALQALQRELGCVMCVLVQLNESGLSSAREVKHDDNGKLIHNMPHRGWVRDSQQIYFAADRFIFLYVPPETSEGAPQTEAGLTRLEVWWVQEKRRKGLTGYARTTFEKSYVRFVPRDFKRPLPGGTEHGEPLGADTTKRLPAGAKVDKSKFLKDQPF